MSLVQALFSDRNRGAKFLATLVAGGVLAWWALAQRVELCVNIEDALAHPQACDGALVAMGLGRTGPASETAFTLRFGGANHVFPQTDPPLAQGQYVSVRGVFTAPDGFRPVFIHPHRSRGIKLAVSLAALLGVGAFLARAFWPRRGGPRA
ncbi:hypothetical protein JCM15519_19020 [Fundidesulfovibrio butyratiphilus]